MIEIVYRYNKIFILLLIISKTNTTFLLNFLNILICKVILKNPQFNTRLKNKILKDIFIEKYKNIRKLCYSLHDSDHISIPTPINILSFLKKFITLLLDHK